jgi:hypothetical protein
MNATTGVLLLGGAAVLGVGVAIAQQKVMAEKTPTQSGLPKGTTFTGNEIPTHTTNPEAERQMATWRQLLTAYKQDLDHWQNTVVPNLQYELSNLESAINNACSTYAIEPNWHCTQNFFTLTWECSDFDRSKTDNNAYSLCKTASADGNSPPPRTVPCQPSLSPTGNFCMGSASTNLNVLNNDIERARSRVGTLAAQYASKKRELQRAQSKIDEIKKNIADLNARGVY